MTTLIRKLLIPGPVGNLEIVIESPITSKRKMLGIICHPHPLEGGTMNNKVVTMVMRVFQKLDIVPIRFNFRGVGQSEGVYDFGIGEQDDLRAVIHWAKSKYPSYKVLLAGFSFGSFIATKVATEVDPVALITIAPPVHHNEFASLPAIDFPWIVVQGEVDEIVPADEVFAWLDSLKVKPIIIKMPTAGHFFHGQLIPLRDMLIEDLTAILAKKE